MLEKIGLPAKPAVRGNNWVVDASHCQGCNSQFTFINRKHHCRRCGGLFCGSCTQQRMVLRGQGDLPVRICEPCKKLEEAARFEMRYCHKSRAGRGSSTSTSKYEDEVLNHILGSAREESFSSVQESNNDTVFGIKRATSSASCSNASEVAAQDGGGEVQRRITLNEPNNFTSDMASASPEELRERALDEKKMYKILKGEGKLGEALKAFKRGKELERQAEALEIYLRKRSKKVLSSGNMADIQNKYGPKESGRKNKIIPSAGKEKDDLAAELRELGWSDKDIHDEHKKLASMTLEGELSSLLGEVSQKININKSSPSIDKTEVVALKKKALMLKREGNLAEAKEELKRAKVLEKQLEEQELLAGAEDSDDELSELIHSMDDDKEELSIQYEQEHNFDFGHIVGTSDDFIVDSSFDVTDEDMDDPEITAALQSLGWTEDSINHEKISQESVPIDREAKLREIQALKIEALNQKRAGNVAEAMIKLKKAKVLERDLEDFESQADDSIVHSPMVTEKHSTFMSDDKFLNSATVGCEDINARKDVGSRLAPKSRLMIQKELLSLKKKALALRREGRLDEAEEELKKGKVLEHQLEHMDNALKVTATKVTVGIKDPDFSYKHPDVNKNISVGEPEGEEDVTDHDMRDPTYLSLLKNLGWTDEDNELENSASKLSKQDDNVSVQRIESSSTQSPSVIVVRSSRSRAELQKELLSLKRKGLALRRQGKTEEAEEVQWNVKALEAQIAEIDAPKKEIQIESNRPKDKIFEPPAESSVEEGDEGDATENDVQDPALLSILKNLGWKDDELEPVTMQEGTKLVAVNTLSTTDPSVIESSSGTPVAVPRSKGEIQRELLGLKRKALALRRKGEMEQVEETLRMAKVLEVQLEDMEVPKVKLMVNASEDERPEPFELLISSRNHGSLEGTVEASKGSVAAVMGSNGQVVQSSVGLGGTETDPINPPLRDSDSISIFSQFPEENNPFSVELVASDKMSPPDNTKTAKYAGYNPPPGQSVNMVDLLTGNDWNYSQKPEQKKEEKLNLGSDELFPTCPAIHLGSVKSPEKDLGSKDHVTTTKIEMVHSDEKPNTYEANSAQEFPLQKVDSSLRQEILIHKRKAVALKREGNLREAREELRQAKLLEKSLEDNFQPKTGPSDVSTSDVPPFGKKDHGTTNLAPKPLSSRERFKLQQESLGHKRQALKLRREGRIEEAEAEFELAKAIEMQLDESAAHDSTVSSVSKLEPADDVVVEDLLDPQLLHALKAIGLEGANMVVPSVPERQQPSKVNAGRNENSNLGRTQLEERIKTEKVKAVSLKRSGKQAEALDALRHAKLLEKKLNSLASQ